MKFSTIYKVFDTVVSVLETRKEDTQQQAPQQQNAPTPGPTSFAEHVEARLTNVVVAALKEAFDRDHARLELERAHLDEQRRRAEEIARRELRRQAIDQEVGRLRLLAGAALAGWVVSVAMVLMRASATSTPARVVMITAWGLLLGSIAAAFTAQSNIGERPADEDGSPQTTAGAAALWLLLAGLALAGGSLLL